MESVIRLASLFFLYSLAGWCIEVTLKYIQYHRFINRGFLTGPVCPIYGSGAVLITASVAALAGVSFSMSSTFVISFLLCGVLEYMTSYVMEKRYHARWWDYSRKPMNLHGRVWAGNLVLFGLGGVAIIHLINPLIDRLLALIPAGTLTMLVCGLTAVLLADMVMTQFVLKLVKSGIEKSEADNTEEITKEIRLLLSDRSVFYRRFADAYPEVIYRTERINARIAAVKEETEKLRREAEARLAAEREHVAESLEPAAMIRSGIIRKQQDLIELLYDENTASEQAARLKEEIAKDMDRLSTRPMTQLTKALPGKKHD